MSKFSKIGRKIHTGIISSILFVQAGVLNLRKLDAIERRIVKTVSHPKYEKPKIYYDVALAVIDKVII